MAVAAVAKGVASAASSRPKTLKVRGTSAQKPVVNTMVIVMGIGVMKRWLVDGEAMPDRGWFVNMGIMGFVLALMSETAPRLGRSMSYLILTAVVFAQSKEILDELQKKKRPAVAPTFGPTVGQLPGSAPNYFTVEQPGMIVERRALPASMSKDWPRPHRYRDRQGPRAAIYG